MTGWLPDGIAEWGGRPVARTVAEAHPRCRAVLTGVVCGVREGRPVPGSHSVEAELRDVTGTLALCWLGRRRVAGIVVGAVVTVEGTVTDRHGRRTLLNPLYRFVGAARTDPAP